MRSCAWLLVLAGCGRIGFDPSFDTLDASLPVGPSLISVDLDSLGMFQGTPALVSVSDVGNGIEDDDPCLTRDELEIFFDSKRENDNNDIFTARRASLAAPWSGPVAITVINTDEKEEHPQVSGDGLTLYFTSDNDIWKTTRRDRSSSWEAPSRVAPVSNADEQAMGSVDAQDLVMVFSTERESGSGIDDLFESRRTSTSQPWGAPTFITELNTDSFDRSAHLDDFGRVMFYEYSSPARIRVTSRASVGAPWSAPKDVMELDGPDAESDPWLSPDLRTIYFAIDKGNGNKDIYTLTR